MKLAFGFLNQPNSLWVRFLRANYKCTSGVSDALPGRTGSLLWKGLGVVWQDVRKNITWSFGHEHDIDFSYDAWIKDFEPLFQYVYACMGTMVRGSPVASMVDMSVIWNWEYLSHFLPQDILLHIVAIKGPNPSLGRASIGWNGTSDRCFSVKSAYIIRAGVQGDEGARIWKFLSRFKG
ncbi:hypothetical protein V6N13_022865 [Hibiscus sabdariffa]